MADVKLRIEVNPDKESEFLNSITNDVGTISNASYKTNGSSAFVGLDNVNESGREMLSWANGVLRFTADGYLSNDGVTAGKLVSESEPDMFVWGAVPQSGEYSVKLTFNGTENLKDIIVYGDPTANQFPTEAIIDGTTTIYSDDYRWAINMGTESETHTIEFTKWNRPNYNACLTRIMVMMRYFPVDKKSGLKSIESLAQSTTQPDNIYYGVMFNDGSAEIVDVGGEIDDMVKDGVIPNSNVPVQLFVNGNQIQTHLTTNSNYNAYSKTLSVELSNEEERLLRVVPMEKADYVNTPSNNLQTYIRGLLINANREKWADLEGQELLAKAQEVLSSEFTIDPVTNQPISIYGYANKIRITEGTYYKEADSVKNNIDEICNIMQLSFVQDADGVWKFVSNRPVFFDESKVIRVPRNVCQTRLNFDLLQPVKYENVKYKKSIRTNSIQQVYNRTFRLKDEDDNFTLAELGERASIRESGGAKWLNFFVDISSMYEAIVPDVTFAKDGVYPVTITLKKPNGSETSGSIVALPNGGNSNATASKQEFDFTSMGATATRVPYYATLNSEVVAINRNIDSSDDFSNYDEITVQIQMRCYSKSEEIKQVNDSEKYVYEWNYSSTLLNDSLKYESNDMQDTIANNIVEDYKNGILVGDINLICQDMFYTDGTKAKDWATGEIINNQDILCFDDDKDKYWRVTGRKVKYMGVPRLELQLQEVKLI